MKRNIFIDFGRAYAILGIAIMHFLDVYFKNGHISSVIAFGGTGVHFFILISGFLLSQKQLCAPDFYKRRFLKVLTPYYLYITLIFILCHFFPLYSNCTFYSYFGYIFFYSMFDLKIFGSLGYPLWFIGTIMQLYLVYPLLIQSFSKVGSRLFLGICFTVSIVWWILIIHFNKTTNDVWTSFFPYFLWEFGTGIVLGHTYKVNCIPFWKLSPKFIVILASAGILTSIVLKIFFPDLYILLNDIPNLAIYLAVLLVIFNICSKWLPPVVTAISALGPVQYEFYLLHVFTLSAVSYCYKKLQINYSIATPILMLSITLLLTITISWIKSHFQSIFHRTVN